MLLTAIYAGMLSMLLSSNLLRNHAATQKKLLTNRILWLHASASCNYAWCEVFVTGL